MIQPQDLRIGNYVTSNGINYIVSKIDIIGNVQGIECGTTFNLDETTEPILLNEEWLLRFGFYKSVWDNFSTYRFMIGENDYTIVIDVYSMYLVEIGDVSLKHINYVHTLQNLVFALTGEELTLKP